MARTPQEITARIDEATQPGFRGRLLARGQARNLIWAKGKIPEGAQQFSPLLTTDLLSYGLGMLNLGLELRAEDRENVAAVKAFERAGEAIEAVIRDGNPEFNERGFYTLLAAAAYHLGHFSARAFSLFPSELETLNLSPAERSLSRLMRRDLARLRQELEQYAGEGGFDATLAAKLDALGEEPKVNEAVCLTLDALYHRAFALFDYALDSGDADAKGGAVALLDEGIEAAGEYGSVPFWWVFTITRHLLEDLWDQSLHTRLPLSPDDPADSKWTEKRRLFIAQLLRRNRAEVEIWPSQLEAATRALDMRDDLVAALPTSAGKTRIAELCILRALALGKRVVFVTPLRALSAQTERSLRQTFTALSHSVSSLYGASGTTGDDGDSLRNRDIVVATPEKLDFALRNDATLLDDVGLVVFDEAHTIGAGEREVRYEVLVQRLLRRADAASRRIVCLSAILPQGEQLTDFLAWMRQDQPGTAITVNWRPTRQRMGEVIWFERDGVKRAALVFRVDDIGEAAPYVDHFVTQMDPKGKQTKALPRNRNDLSVMSAWRLVAEGQTVLMYCPERRSVMPLARIVIDLVHRGYLPSLLGCDPKLLHEALTIGREWLGDNHPAVQCLRVGVAVHHGQLPRPFLRAVERLLKDQLLKVTIASPTLAQGLNLSATTVLFTGLTRSGRSIPGEEFANVAGRAGRAFVDVEGQVLCSVWEKKHLQRWNALQFAAKERNLKSGLLQLVIDFCNRIALKKEIPLEQVLEYVAGNANPWIAPRPKNFASAQEAQEQVEFERRWRADVASLDSALLSLVQHDVPLAELASAIDESLTSSLWERSLKRESKATQKIAKLFLEKRATFIWERTTPVQRKGYFFAGVGLTTGAYLDQHAEALNAALIEADTAFASGEIDQAHAALVKFATLAFGVEPFKPADDLPPDWPEIMRAWISAEGMSDLAGDQDEEVLEFIEGALVYRLVWAMEAVRVRQTAADEETEWPDAGRAALALETGTPDYCASLLIQNGLASRIAAMKAIADCPASFNDIEGLRDWVNSDAVDAMALDENWPTPETAAIWATFTDGLAVASTARWDIHEGDVDVVWSGEPLPPDSAVRLSYDANNKRMKVFSPEMDPVGYLPYAWKAAPTGIALGTVCDPAGKIAVTYVGPSDFFRKD
ncbi:MAG TPA: DEAD/DEAH box helicase [Lacunisphaera sp.]|nr:DEAD/DEAH box helicase [Lacunisphaera sp.]